MINTTAMESFSSRRRPYRSVLSCPYRESVSGRGKLTIVERVARLRGCATSDQAGITTDIIGVVIVAAEWWYQKTKFRDA